MLDACVFCDDHEKTCYGRLVDVKSFSWQEPR